MGWEKDEARWAHMMQLSQRGDSAVYHTLLSELSSVAERYLRARFGDYSFIEDCVQECLIALHNARHTYAPEYPFRPWFFAIVKYKVIDFLRANKRKNAHHSDVDIDTVTDDTQKANLEAGIVKGQLMKGLKPEYQEVIVLGKFMGYSTKEMAQQLGTSEGAIKVRIHRALKALKKHIESEQYE